MVGTMLLGAVPAWGQSLRSLFREAAQGGEFAMPTAGELAEARLMFDLLLKGKLETAAFKELLDSLGMEQLPVTEVGTDFVVLREKEGRKTGRGFYIYTNGATAHRYLLVPHAFTDVKTGHIALKLVDMGCFSLVALNTRKRYEVRDNLKIDQDLAHLTGTYFSVLSHALAALADEPRVVQIHGYSKGNRETEAGMDADVIVSSGRRSLQPYASAVAECLSRNDDYNVMVYPDQVYELGGTTNVTARIMRKAGNKSFLHIEMSRPFRDMLSKDEKFLKVFNECVAGSN